MKELVSVSIIILLTCSLFSQVPEGFNYQAIVRSSGGQEITNQAVGMQISLLQYATDGSAIYVERFTPTTNNFGLVNLVIGSGATQSGSFSSINWSDGPFFIKVEMDESGGTTFIEIGTSQLLSVPYSLHAGKADEYDEIDPAIGKNTTNFLPKWNGSEMITSSIFDNNSIGIGTKTPEELLDVNGNAIIRGILDSDWIDVNSNNTGDRYAGIDFFGDDIRRPYSMRLMRYPGENGISILGHRGAGALQLFSVDGGDIELITNSSHRMKILANGNVGIGTETPSEKLTVNGNLLVNGSIDFDGTIGGDIAIDSVHVSKITGLLGEGFTMSFPDILNNYVLLEISGINLLENVIMIGSLGHETERISIPNGVDGNRNPIYLEQPGLTMEYPVIFETTSTDDANALISWFDDATPNVRSGSVVIKNLAGIETDRWNFLEYIPAGYEEGNDGRTRFTLVHNHLPDNLLRCVYLEDFGSEASYNPATDKLIDGPFYSNFTPAVEVDYNKRTIILTMDYVEGAGLKHWAENTVLGIQDPISLSIIETNDGTTEISRRNYFECIPIKYEHFYGFGQNIKLKAKVVIAFGAWQEGQ